MKNHALASASGVGEDAMVNGVVLRAISRIVRDALLQPQLIRRPLQVFFEQVLGGVIASAAVAQDQQAFGLGVGRAAMLIPPQRDAVATEFAGVVAGIQIDVSVLAGPVRGLV